MTDREGKEVRPSEFLHTRLLASESGELTDLGKSLVSLFPSLECATLPIPSTKRDIICSILENQDKLKPVFNAAVDSLIQEILHKVGPKKAVDGTTTVNGKALAALAGGYVEAVNKPGALPDLDQGWQAVVRLELEDYSYRLAREYEREMEDSLKGNLPMEEMYLLKIHQQTLNRKKSNLREEVCRLNPLHSCDDEAQPLLDRLEQDIVQWSEPSSLRGKKVAGGSLHQFVVKNFSVSKERCEMLLNYLIKDSKIHETFESAVRQSVCLDIQKGIKTKYNRRAVGPAASEVLERGLSELSQLSDTLNRIPSAPRNVQVIGKGSDRVKLSWEPPARNPEAVEEYVVSMRVEDGEWEEAARTVKTRVVVKGLKSCAKYDICVLGTNAQIMGRTRSGTEAATNATAADGALNGALAFLPGVGVLLTVAGKLKPTQQENFFSEKDHNCRVATGLAVLPLCLPAFLFLAPLAPVGAVAGAVGAASDTTGDLTEE